MRPLRDVLRERREPLSLRDGLGDWQAITVKFSGEVIPRQRDHAFKGTMFAAYAGDLVFSKIDARNGAIGLIPDRLPKAVVTSEYPILIPDPATLRAAYLHLLMGAEHFKADLQRKASGTSGRKRITPEGFLGLVVPVPTLAEQDALVSAYSAALDHAARLEQEAQAIEDAGLRAFEAALGVTAPPPLPERPVFVARFRDIEQWSHEGTLRASLGNREVSTATYPVIQLREVASISYGLQKSPANRPALHARPYLRVANVQRGHLILDEIKTINVPDENLLALRLEVGDILFVEGNGSRKELGRVALWHGQIADCVHQNHIIKARPDLCRLLPDFAMAWFNIAAGRDHFFQSGKTTSGLGTINSSVIRSAPIPLPPISDQRRLMEVLANASQSAATKLTEAQTLRASAWTAFESALFTTNDSPESHAGGSTRP